MRIHSPARPSPIAPKNQHHNFAAIVAQLKTPAVNILTFDVRSDMTYLQIFQFEEILIEMLTLGRSQQLLELTLRLAKQSQGFFVIVAREA